jgi:uncharacterized protein (TIGR03435 family)
MRGGVLRGSRYDVRTATMVDLIGTAYHIESDKIIGGPNWLDWDRFDIAATAPPTTTRDNLNLMLQQMLADRFHLVVRKDTRPMPAFALTTGKTKPKMKPASGAGEGGCKDVPQNPAPGTVPYFAVSCQNVTMKAFAGMLNGFALAGGFNGNYLPNPVVDETGIDGAWDFEMKWTPQPRLPQAGADGISLFDAVDRQLGLKLEPQKLPLPVLIVESVNQKPTPNEPGVAAKIAPAPPTEFEIATIKLTAPDVKDQMGRLQNGRLDLRNFTLRQILQIAWDINDNPEMIAGLPKSADSVHYDVTAKVASTGLVDAQQVDYDTLQIMLRGLLAERFGLKTHMEDRPVSAYTMTAGPQTKLMKADPQNRTNCKSGGSPKNPILNRVITCQNTNMTQFAGVLQNLVQGYVKAPIKDATGLDGYYDFVINFTGVSLLPGARFDPNANSGSADPNGAMTLPEAMLKQLGLKLEMGKRPLPVLVVDHVEDKPADN